MKKACRAALTLLALVLCCILANFAATFIDTPRLRANAAQGVAMLGEQGATPELTGGFKSSQPDNYTSVLILKTAAYTGAESRLMRTFGGFRTDMPTPEGGDAWAAFCTYADGTESPTGGLSYSRYWHGYILPLRILLCFFNTANIQMLLLALQGLLCGCLLLLLQKRRVLRLAPGFFAAFFVMMPSVTGLCLQYAPVTLLMLISCCLLLAAEDWIRSFCGFPAFFAAVGLMTSYLDLLTFPMITISFPLAMLIALQLDEGRSGTALLKDSVLCILAWGIGFAGMWAFKWLLNMLVFGSGYTGGIAGQIALRMSSSSHGTSYSRLGMLLRNFNVILAKSSYLLILLLAGLASLAASLRRGRPDPRALLLLLPAAIPIVWMLLTTNHIYDHTYYTYRNIAGFLFACFALLSCLIKSRKTEK